MSQRTSPDSAVFKVVVVGSHDNQIQNEGTLEATPTSLIYTDNQGSKFVWSLTHISKYGSNGEKLFTIETGQECPMGAGVFIFSTSHAPYLESIVSRHIASKARLSASPDSESFLSPTRNGVSATPTNGRTMFTSSSLWNLSSNQFPVRSLTEDPNQTKDGLLEVTAQEIVFTEGRSGHQYVWPISLLRRYGYNGNKFSFDASSRCPGGGGVFGFLTQKAMEIQELVRRHSKSLSGSQELSIPTSSPPTGGRGMSPSRGHLTRPLGGFGREKRGSLRRARSAMDLNRHLFEVVNISDDLREVGKGTLEVTTSDLIYIDHLTEEKWRWPLRYLRRYGCDGRVFSFEAGRRCPGGEGLYAFSCSRAAEIHEAIVMGIKGPQKSSEHAQMFVSTLSLADPTLRQGAGLDTSLRQGARLDARRSSEQGLLRRNNGLHLTPPPLSRKHIPLPKVPCPTPSPPLPEDMPPRGLVDMPPRGSVSSPSLDENDSSSVSSSGVVTPPPSGTSSPPPKPPRNDEHRKKKKDKNRKVKKEQVQVEMVRTSSAGEPHSAAKPHPPPPYKPKSQSKKEKPAPPPKPRPQSGGSPGKDKRPSPQPVTKDKKEKSPKKSSLMKMLSKRRSVDVGPKDAPSDPAHLEGVVPKGLYDTVDGPVGGPSMYANISTHTPPTHHTSTPPTHHSMYANISRQGSVGKGEVSVSCVPTPHRGDTPPPHPLSSTPDSPSLYQNVELRSEKQEMNSYANVELKTKKVIPTKYAELEIIDSFPPSEPNNQSHDINGKAHDSSPDPQSPDLTKGEVQYEVLNFQAMRAVEKIQATRGKTEQFAEMLERHILREDEARTTPTRGKSSKK